MLSPPQPQWRPSIPSPSPSEPLLRLQRLGLELGSSSAPNSHQSARSAGSRNATPDLDKPLPIKPQARHRRSSSVYSAETTISQIIGLYGGEQDDELPPTSQMYQPQAYRDTLAPLLARRLSNERPAASIPLLWQKPSPTPPMVSTDSVGGTITTYSALNNKGAPSFVDFSRRLGNRRTEVVSPLSSPSVEYHRRVALERLAAPPPNKNHEAQEYVFERDSFLPGPISGTISDVVAAELVPRPLNLDRISRLVETNRTERKSEPYHPETAQHFRGGATTVSSWSSDSSVQHGGKGESLIGRLKEKLKRKEEPGGDDEIGRVMSQASKKYPGIKRGHFEKRSSFAPNIELGSSHRFSGAVENVSPSEREAAHPAMITPRPRRQKQLAIPLTPYQKYGEAIWKENSKKKKRKGKGRRHTEQSYRTSAVQARSRYKEGTSPESKPATSAATELRNAYHDGQNQIVDVLEGARRKLTRSSAEKRREKLKNSIILVGPTLLTEGRNSIQEPKKWI